MSERQAGLFSRLASELGMEALAQSPLDTKLMCLQRFVRLFAYGASFLILVHFLASLGIPDGEIGLFMTLTLLGDAAISLVLTLLTDKLGRRRVLAFGAASMVVSGAVFALSSNYWVLVIASVVGVISPSGNEVGPFRAVEESILAQLTDKNRRTDIYTWYTLFGTAGAAFGSLSSGWAVQFLQDTPSWDPLEAYRVVFALYSALGGLKLVITLLLSNSVELPTAGPAYQRIPESDGEAGDINEGDVGEDDVEGSDPPASSTWRSMLPHISPGSRGILARLLLLFTLDSFASGLASPSWVTYFFTTVHHLPPGSLGTLFLVTNVLATLSNFAALPLARRLGPLMTMCFTHLPSALFLGLIPVPPATGPGTWLAMAFLSLRACTQSMDQAPRQAFLSAAVLPSERTTVLGVVNVAKTLAQAGGIGASGPLARARLWTVMLGTAGGLKATYDLLMLWMFLGVREREADGEGDVAGGAGGAGETRDAEEQGGS